MKTKSKEDPRYIFTDMENMQINMRILELQKEKEWLIEFEERKQAAKFKSK